MNRYLLLLATACIVVAVAGSAPTQAAPSFRGYTGLIKIPSCDTLNKGWWNLGVMTENASDFNANDIFVNYGIVDNLEVGFNAFQRAGTSMDRGGPSSGKESRQTLINAKYRFLPETESRAGVAFGVTDVTNAIDTTPYGIISKSLVKGLTCFDGDILNVRGHIGIGGGQFDGVFVGLSTYVGTRLEAMFEWDSHDPNVGIRITPLTGLRLHVAWFDVGGRVDVGLGMSYN